MYEFKMHKQWLLHLAVLSNKGCVQLFKAISELSDKIPALIV